MRHHELVETIQNLTGHKPKQQEIADILEISINTISGRATRNSKYTFEEIKKIGEYYNIDLFSKSTVNVLVDNYIEGKQRNLTQSKNFVELDFYTDVCASCGNGVVVFSEEKTKIPVAFDLIKNYSENNTYSVITAKGDSMSGVIEPKDKLIIRHITNESIIDNHIYVFAYNDEIYVKFLSKNIDEIMVRSNNPDYKTKYITDLENVRLIGEVIGLIRDLGV